MLTITVWEGSDEVSETQVKTHADALAWLMRWTHLVYARPRASVTVDHEDVTLELSSGLWVWDAKER